jgi:hypothetical protein
MPSHQVRMYSIVLWCISYFDATNSIGLSFSSRRVAVWTLNVAVSGVFYMFFTDLPKDISQHPYSIRL